MSKVQPRGVLMTKPDGGGTVSVSVKHVPGAVAERLALGWTLAAPAPVAPVVEPVLAAKPEKPAKK